MATIGKAALPATTLTRVCDSGSSQTIGRVILCNRASSAVAVRLAFSARGVQPIDEDYILYDASIPANTTILFNTDDFRISGPVSVWGYAGSADISIRVTD